MMIFGTRYAFSVNCVYMKRNECLINTDCLKMKSLYGM